MEKTSSKNFVFWIVIFVSLIVATVSFTYAFFSYMRTGTTTSTVHSGSIKMEYNGTNPGVNLTDVEPVSDETALNRNENSFEFNVNYEVNGSAKITYGIYLENLTSKLDDVISGEYTSLPTNKLKVALEDITNSQIVVNPIFYSAVEQNTFVENVGNLLYTRTVNGNNSDAFKLYMWIPSLDIEGNPVNIHELYSKTFSFIVNVKAIASVTE